MLGSSNGSVPEEESAVTPEGVVVEPEPVVLASQQVPAPTGFALVPRSTTVHQRATEESPAFAVEPGDSTDLEPRVFRVVGEEAGWIALQNVGADALEKHCVPGWGDLVAYRLRFWVKEQDLLQVTSRPTLQEFENGTSAMLAAGTPVLRNAGSPTSSTVRADVLIGGEVLAGMPLDGTAIGRFYEPGPHFIPSKPERILPNEQELTIDGGLPLLTAGLNGPVPGVDIYGVQPKNDGAIVTVGTPCAEFRAWAATMVEPLAIEGSVEAVLADVVPEPSAAPTPVLPKWKVSADTQVFWSDGEPAGQVIVAQVFDVDPETRGDKRCFSVEPPGVELCFPADALRPLAVEGAMEQPATAEAARSPDSTVIAAGGRTAESSPAASATQQKDESRALAVASSAPAENTKAEPSSAGVEEGAKPEIVAAVNPVEADDKPADSDNVESAAVKAEIPEDEAARAPGTKELVLNESESSSEVKTQVAQRGVGETPGPEAAVNSASPNVTGALGSKEVRRVLASRIGEVRRCYEEGLGRIPTLGGAMTISFIINPSGRTSRATVRRSSLADRQVESCIAQRVRGWSFPEPEGGGLAVVQAPFVFKPAPK